MKTLKSKKRLVFIVFIVFFITMISISLGLTKGKSIEKEEIKRATFVRAGDKGEFYFE